MTLGRFMAIAFIAKGLIDSLHVVAVEGNPDSAAYIELNAKNDEKFSVVAKVLGDEERRDRYLGRAFDSFHRAARSFSPIGCACSYSVVRMRSASIRAQ